MIKSDAPKVGALIGFGSAGARHLRAMSQFLDRIHVFDSMPSKSSAEWPEGISVVFHSDFDDFSAALFECGSDLKVAAIATWAPSHYDYFHFLSKLPLQNIVVEKIASDSPEEILKMEATAASKSFRLHVPLIWRYTGLSDYLSKCRGAGHLGSHLGSSALIGGKGFTEFGVHLLDTVLTTTSTNCVGVHSDLTTSSPSSRSESIVSLNGHASFELSDGTAFNVSILRASSLGGHLHLLFEGCSILLTPQGKLTIDHHEIAPECDNHLPGDALVLDIDSAWISFYSSVLGEKPQPNSLESSLWTLLAVQASEVAKWKNLETLKGMNDFMSKHNVT